MALMPNIREMEIIIEKLREYQQTFYDGKDGWTDSFYDGIEFAIDFLSEAIEENGD